MFLYFPCVPDATVNPMLKLAEMWTEKLTVLHTVCMLYGSIVYSLKNSPLSVRAFRGLSVVMVHYEFPNSVTVIFTK